MIEPALLKVILPAHTTILSAVDQSAALKSQLQSAFILIIKRYQEKADKSRYRALSLQGVLIVLSVASTIFVGLKFYYLELLWANVIVVLCAIITGLWTFETYKDYQRVWLRYLALQDRVKRLRDEYQSVLEGANFVSKRTFAAEPQLITEQVHIKYWNKLQLLLNSINPAGLEADS
ncbi:MAG: ABC-type siderophore export system fused ATPase/permease subunit [Psychromonas sp.]|jgi:ABC-type siderophore export system fused ATPase/permease subunit|uniref:DUF4231 domain-containing protein n=1 Tax=Psychromonas sp. TaxID=1884585 RepID=UPI0039E49322